MKIIPPIRARHRVVVSGFTRADLLACLAALALIGLLWVPALASTSTAAHAAVCRANLGRLLIAWTQFANDNQGTLPWNADGSSMGWVQGWLNYSPSNSPNTNTLFLTDGRFAQMGPYVADARLFKCPSDLTTSPFIQPDEAVWRLPRVRSYSINAAMAPRYGPAWLGDGYRFYRKLHDIVAPPPASTWVFIDEHPDSINDAAFAVKMPASAAGTSLVDIPAAHHDRSGVLAFADAHVEFHPWTDARTMPPVRNLIYPLNIEQPYNEDVLWLSARTSSRR